MGRERERERERRRTGTDIGTRGEVRYGYRKEGGVAVTKIGRWGVTSTDIGRGRTEPVRM
jgi:hypothetical protein